MYPGLVITSICFLIPSMIAFKKNIIVDAILSVGLATTSILYHSAILGGTKFATLIQAIDMTLAHYVAMHCVVRKRTSLARKVKYVFHILLGAVSRRRKKMRIDEHGGDVAGMLVSPVCGLLFYKVSRNRTDAQGQLAHMLIHVIAVSYWSFMLHANWQ